MSDFDQTIQQLFNEKPPPMPKLPKLPQAELPDDILELEPEHLDALQAAGKTIPDHLQHLLKRT